MNRIDELYSRSFSTDEEEVKELADSLNITIEKARPLLLAIRNLFETSGRLGLEDKVEIHIEVKRKNP